MSNIDATQVRIAIQNLQIDRVRMRAEAMERVEEELKRRTHQVKMDVSRLVNEPGAKKARVARDVGITGTTLYRWLKEVEEDYLQEVFAERGPETEELGEKYTYSLNNRNYIRVTNNHAAEGDVRTLTLYTQHAHIAEFREDKVDERGDRQWQAGERYLKLEEWPDWFKSDLEEILRGSQVLGDIGVRDSEVAEIMWDYGAKLANEGMEVPEGWM